MVINYTNKITSKSINIIEMNDKLKSWLHTTPRYTTPVHTRICTELQHGTGAKPRRHQTRDCHSFSAAVKRISLLSL